jgi:hypothetical protein
VVPPAVAGVIALGVATPVSWLVAGYRPQFELGTIAAAFIAVLACVLRVSFPDTLHTLLGHLPSGSRVQRLFGFSLVPAGALAAAGK